MPQRSAPRWVVKRKRRMSDAQQRFHQKLKLMKAKRLNTTRGIENVFQTKDTQQHELLQELMGARGMREKKQILKDIFENKELMEAFAKHAPQMMESIPQQKTKRKKNKKDKKNKKNKAKEPSCEKSDHPPFECSDTQMKEFGSLLDDLECDPTPAATTSAPATTPTHHPADPLDWGDLLADLD